MNWMATSAIVIGALGTVVLIGIGFVSSFDRDQFLNQRLQDTQDLLNALQARVRRLEALERKANTERTDA